MKKANKAKAKCKQCGACCSIWNGNGWEDCKYLIRYIRGDSHTKDTRCMIYQHRLYSITGKGQYCGTRDKHQWNYPNCPFNKKHQKTHPRFIKTQVD